MPAKKIAVRKVSETPEFTRVKKGLIKMADKRPRKLKSLMKHVQAMLGREATVAAADAMVRKLELAKVVHIAGDLVLYG